MFDRTLFRLFGFPVRVDTSWLFIAGLVTWSLGSGIFPSRYPGLSSAVYWSMGILGAVGLFASILFHELSHAVVARGFGMEIRGLRLFIFGGVAEMHGLPRSPRAEFLTAGAGPVSSLLLGGLAYLAGELGREALPLPVRGVLAYLAGINVVLGVFNLLPAFPLDGGRLLRAVLWARQGDIRGATRVTARIGAGFGLALAGLGVITMIRGQFLGGAWWILIGLFLRGAAAQAGRVEVPGGGRRGVSVRRFMDAAPVIVTRETRIRDLMESDDPRTRDTLYPVVEDGILLGSLTLDSFREAPRENWENARVQGFITPFSPETCVAADEDTRNALARMHALGVSRLLVVEGSRLVGVLSLRDLLGLSPDPAGRNGK